MFKTLITKASRSYRAARTRRELGSLPDNILHDIGLSRCEIDAAKLPINEARSSFPAS